MKIGSRRFVRAGLRSAAAITALAVTLPLTPAAGAQDLIPGLPAGDGLPGIGLYQPLYPVALCVRGGERQAAE